MNELFSRLGLNAKETETFLRLLSLGAQPISVVAKHVGIPRSSMYFVVERLKSRHLIEEFERAGIRYVKCIPATDIADVLKAEERNIQQTFQILKEQLPALQSMENARSITPKVTFAEGKEAVMNMYESLAKDRRFFAFFNPAIVKKLVPAYLTIIPEILRAHGGEAKEIVVDSKEARIYKKRFGSVRHRIKILPKGVAFLSDCIMCKDRICMVTYGEDQVAAIEIFSSTLASTQRTIFEQFWQLLP